ncbi:MAG TPA: hypothetical protein VFB72_18855 [Verrucomicrobiae bacterium]|nr:hypothetical protein [Verrucomicrobiae bacterium]
MEVYFKNLTPEEGTADKLLHDINVLGENTEELFRVSQGKLAEKSKEKFLQRLERIKAACRAMQEQSAKEAASHPAASETFPYTTMGIVFGVGILMGVLFGRGSE